MNEAAAKGEKPLRLRLPPTLVFGLPPIHNPEEAEASLPLWLWFPTWILSLDVHALLRCACSA